MLGNPGWDWEHMEPYFKKFQTINPPPVAIQGISQIEWLGEDCLTSGPIQASYPLRPGKFQGSMD